ncbi:MAG: carbohydrate kinase [Bacteroidaceae bacterium]|nr:carbohydrate kinase [Bacteroidaceae bacterium]
MEKQRRVIGVGESILDILFRDGQPMAAVHGGSSFNSIVSVGRAGVPCTFVGYSGADIVGQNTVRFLNANGVDTQHFQLRKGEKSAVSLAFIGQDKDASYLFYKEQPRAEASAALPQMSRGDVMLFGSYYAVCDGMRPLISKMLEQAARQNAIVYYDLNFRSNHSSELEQLRPAIRQNIRQSTIVRGSTDDLEVLFSSRDARVIYNMYISQHCPYFICTAGAGQVVVCTPGGIHEFQAPPVEDVVSTVGAGDSFNAGFTCALIWEDIMPQDLPSLSKDDWQRLVGTACDFASQTCQSTENYIKYYEKYPHNPHHFGTRT